MNKWRTLYSVLFFLVSLQAISQDSIETKPYKFGLLRQFDDVDFLKRTTDKTIYDHLKLISLGERAFLSFAGSYRTQFEYFNDQDFIGDATDSWWLNRIMLSADLRMEDWQLFLEANSSTILSKERPSPVDRDEFAISQFFLKYDNGDWMLKLGRENVTYGSNRLITFREGPNVRRYFDGANVIRRLNSAQMELLYYQLVNINPFGFDNDALDGDEHVYGTYNTVSTKSKSHNWDLYYLKFQKDLVRYQQGVGKESRHSVGVRYFGDYNKNFRFDFEGVYQFGDFSTSAISAWTVSSNIQYFFGLPNDSFVLGLKTEIITGDDTGDDMKLNTFNALYPRGAYFGRIAQFGPANLIDVHPSLTYSTNKWTFFADYVAFWRESTNDGVYGAGLNLAYQDLNDSKFIAHQVGAAITLNFSKYLSFGAESNYLIRGDFIKSSDLNANTLHFLCEAQLKF